LFHVKAFVEEHFIFIVYVNGGNELGVKLTLIDNLIQILNVLLELLDFRLKGMNLFICFGDLGSTLAEKVHFLCVGSL
jgi:hypothetical protein